MNLELKTFGWGEGWEADWPCAQSWLSSTTVDRHLAPSPDGGAPQGKGSFFSKQKISLDFVGKL